MKSEVSRHWSSREQRTSTDGLQKHEILIETEDNPRLGPLRWRLRFLLAEQIALRKKMKQIEKETLNAGFLHNFGGIISRFLRDFRREQ
uniref:Uncharacterized protein n=1 Tax=Noccaea caerulescens TaxID=107243 RepID=A0A1J3JE11_NOCCA